MPYWLRLILARLTYVEWVERKAKHSAIWKAELAWMRGETNQ